MDPFEQHQQAQELQQPRMQAPDTVKTQISEAQANMMPVIENICQEATGKQASGLDPTWENLRALGLALSTSDVDTFCPMTNHDSQTLEKTRPAKLRWVEILYDHAKQMSKRELLSFLYYSMKVAGEMEDLLLEGAVEEGYWTKESLARELLAFRCEQGSYEGGEEDDNVGVAPGLAGGNKIDESMME